MSIYGDAHGGIFVSVKNGLAREEWPPADVRCPSGQWLNKHMERLALPMRIHANAGISHNGGGQWLAGMVQDLLLALGLAPSPTLALGHALSPTLAFAFGHAAFVTRYWLGASPPSFNSMYVKAVAKLGSKAKQAGIVHHKSLPPVMPGQVRVC